MPPNVSWPVDAVLDAVGEHDHPGAGAERGQAARDQLANRVEELEHGGQLPQRGRLAAGDDQAVYRLDLIQAAHRLRGRARLPERAHVLADVALEGEYSDDRQSQIPPLARCSLKARVTAAGVSGFTAYNTVAETDLP